MLSVATLLLCTFASAAPPAERGDSTNETYDTSSERGQSTNETYDTNSGRGRSTNETYDITKDPVFASIPQVVLRSPEDYRACLEESPATCESSYNDDGSTQSFCKLDVEVPPQIPKYDVGEDCLYNIDGTLDCFFTCSADEVSDCKTFLVGCIANGGDWAGSAESGSCDFPETTSAPAPEDDAAGQVCTAAMFQGPSQDRTVEEAVADAWADFAEPDSEDIGQAKIEDGCKDPLDDKPCSTCKEDKNSNCALFLFACVDQGGTSAGTTEGGVCYGLTPK